MKKNVQHKGVAIIGTRERGGISSVIENYIQAGVYDGYKHYFIASHDEAGISKRLALALGSLLSLIKLIVLRKVSLCHLHGSYRGSIYRKALFVFVCRLFGCKVIFHLHGSEFAKNYDNAWKLYQHVVGYVLNRSNSIFVLSKYWKDYVKSISNNPDIRVINNFPSPVFEDIFDKRDFSRAETTELLFLGYIGQRKGIYDLVEAVSLLKVHVKKGFCITVGGNGDADILRKLITEKGLDDYFKVIGWVSGEQKYELMKQSHLLLLPSHNEGLPIAILEALSSGLAVLSTKVGGIPDAIQDERYGLLVEPGQPKELANAISRYLDTDDLIETVARNARKLYDMKYSSKANVKLIRNVINDLI
jgi:glycosyltransferase involved in cell wall biosynthesis